MAPKPAEFDRIMQNNGHYAVQGYWKSPFLPRCIFYQSKARMRLRISINSNLILSRTISKLLYIICAFDKAGTSLTHSFGDRSLNLTEQYLALKKLETSLYRMVQNAFRYFEPFRRGSRQWQTDRQTDRHTERRTKLPLAISLSNGPR